MMTEPALELRPDFGEGCRRVDIGLADVGQLAAERGQLRSPPRAHETLEMPNFPALAVDQGRADFNDFHLRDRPAAIVCGCFKVDHQPMAHSRLPCKTG
ncbi:hypothetical protein D3C80_913240 [compost metagenome]